jgi:hypothetical protein
MLRPNVQSSCKTARSKYNASIDFRNARPVAFCILHSWWPPVIGRLFISVVVGFMLGATSLVLLPGLGRLAGPVVCCGQLTPDPTTNGRLGWRCTQPDGSSTEIAPEQIIITTVLAFSALALLPVSRGMRAYEEQRRDEQRQWREDAANAITGQAEVLRLALVGPPKRRILMRAAEVRLTLWVQLPNDRPYEAWVIWMVEEPALERVLPGKYVAVRLNPAQRERIYPAFPGAEFLRTERYHTER